MNLIELFYSLTLPPSNENILNAVTIPGYPNFKIAVDIEGNPSILLSITCAINNIALKNFRLKYLQLQQNIECKVSENGKSSFSTFTIIKFTGSDKTLQEYFLRISESLIKSICGNPTQEQLIESLNKFVEVFRSLTDPPTNTVHGLWSELFVIETSSNPKMLLNYWHNKPEEKFDFNSGQEKIEVKSNSNFERIHIFSSAQLNPEIGSNVLIASIFIRQNNNGISIQHLIDSIITFKIQNEMDIISKLNNIISKTLGNTLEQSIKIKFDYNIAKDSLRFYRHQDILKIEEIYIPKEVTEVHYKSNLTNLKDFKIDEINPKGILFSSL